MNKNTCQLKSHVFVVGFPRSGTTLLKRLIESHSSFVVGKKGNLNGEMFYTPETHLFSKLYNKRINNVLPIDNVAKFFNDDDQYSKFKNSIKYIVPIQRYILNWILPYRYFVTTKNRIKNQLMLHYLSIIYYYASMNNKIVERYFENVEMVRSGQRIVEKTPYHYKYISEIHSSFPEAKILFISRHPVDVYSSFRKRLLLDNSWKDLTIDEFCSQYRECYQSIEWHVERKLEYIISIKYEKLVQDPKTTFNKVCSFIDEEFEELCLQGDNSIKGPVWDKYVHKHIIKNTKSWKDFITEEEAKEIEFNLTDIMSKFEYTSYI